MTSGKGVLKGGQEKSSGLKQHIFGYSTDWPFISSDALYFFMKSEKVNMPQQTRLKLNLH